MDVLSRILASIEQNQLLMTGETVLVAVSGGADSLCLLHCLHQLGVDVVVAHLDHQLRPSSAAEAAYVRQVAEAYQLPVWIGKGDVRGKIGEGCSMEEAARDVRYRFLARQARQHSISSIATGHTQDDQVETILMHILRGAGSAGLQGMRPKESLDQIFPFPDAKGLFLIRPMLEVGHVEAMQYCREQGLAPREDESNWDERYLRNRIRHRLLPTLEEYNPRIRKAMLRMAEIMRGEHAIIRDLADGTFQEILLHKDAGKVLLDREGFREQGRGLQREILRIAIRFVMGNIKNVGFKTIERALDFSLEEGGGGWVPLGEELRLNRTHSALMISREDESETCGQYPQLEHPTPIMLSGVEAIHLGSSWRLQVGRKAMECIDLENLDHWHVALDPAKFQGSVVLRRPMEGDRIQPFGMSGSMKLSDIFINGKIPRSARKHWPVLADQEHVLWVVGLKYGRAACVTEETKHVLCLHCDPVWEAEA